MLFDTSTSTWNCSRVRSARVQVFPPIVEVMKSAFDLSLGGHETCPREADGAGFPTPIGYAISARLP